MMRRQEIIAAAVALVKLRRTLRASSLSNGTVAELEALTNIASELLDKLLTDYNRSQFLQRVNNRSGKYQLPQVDPNVSDEE